LVLFVGIIGTSIGIGIIIGISIGIIIVIGISIGIVIGIICIIIGITISISIPNQRGAKWSVLLTQYCTGDKIEKNEMGWACGAYG